METAYSTDRRAINPNSNIYRGGLNENLTVKIWPELMDQLQGSYEAAQSQNTRLTFADYLRGILVASQDEATQEELTALRSLDQDLSYQIWLCENKIRVMEQATQDLIAELHEDSNVKPALCNQYLQMAYEARMAATANEQQKAYAAFYGKTQ